MSCHPNGIKRAYNVCKWPAKCARNGRLKVKVNWCLELKSFQWVLEKWQGFSEILSQYVWTVIPLDAVKIHPTAENRRHNLWCGSQIFTEMNRIKQKQIWYVHPKWVSASLEKCHCQEMVVIVCSECQSSVPVNAGRQDFPREHCIATKISRVTNFYLPVFNVAADCCTSLSTKWVSKTFFEYIVQTVTQGFVFPACNSKFLHIRMQMKTVNHWDLNTTDPSKIVCAKSVPKM